MATKRTDKTNRPTHKQFDVRVTPRPGRRDQRIADASVAQFRAYSDQQQRLDSNLSPQAAYDQWLDTADGKNCGPNELAEVERTVAKLMLAWQMAHPGE